MDFKIFQIYFQERQLKGLDPAFIPYDNSQSTNRDYREFYIFRKEYLAGHVSPDAYTGYLSWKFQQKTRLQGQKFIDFCRAHPGYDVYFVNPFPTFVALGNVWASGERFHPGLGKLSQKILDGIGSGIKLDEVPNSLALNAYCNFWVGNRKFWDAYMGFCMRFVDYIETELDAESKSKLFTRADRRTDASHFAYIMERLFSTFLSAHPEIKFLSYRYSESELAQNLRKNEVELLMQIARFEDSHPGTIDPLKLDPQLQMALKDYWQERWEDQSLLSAIRKPIQFLWHRVPYRAELLRIPIVYNITEILLRLLSKDPKFSIESKK